LTSDQLGEQGYLLFSDKSHLIVAANSGQGLFSGVQTLRQLLSPAHNGLLCPAVGIRDWPTIDWKGLSGSAQKDANTGAQSLSENKLRPQA
jgi:N-acetyl-beta-hexosaminidase